MKLSSSEKLILTMLCDIHEKLGIKDGFDSEFIKAAIFSGNTWGLDWKYGGLLDVEDTDMSVVREVCNILDMWSCIESSYDRLSPDDVARVAAETAPFGKPRFFGFDGNNESDHISVARFLIESLERFPSFKDRELNSHMPSLATHRRMYVAFDAVRHTLSNGIMGVDVLTGILKERTHPSNRTA